MLQYVVRRIYMGIGTVVAISIIVFAVVEAPPGDAVTNAINSATVFGSTGALLYAEELRAFYGLDRPMPVRYYLCGSRGWLRAAWGGHLLGALNSLPPLSPGAPSKRS